MSSLMAWNGLPVALRLTQVGHSAQFFSGLKTTLFDQGWAESAPELLPLKGRYIKQVRIFENIETTSETKTRNLTTTIYHNENNYFNYLHPIIFKIFKPSLSPKLTCRAY